jgi:hypothetical protein
MAPAGLDCKRVKVAPPAILTAAVNARTVAAWEVLIHPANLKKLMSDDLRLTIQSVFSRQ